MVIITEKTLKKLVKEFLITIGYLSIATLIGMLLIYIGFTESNVTMVYLLCVLLLSIFTNGYIWSVAGSLVSVVLMNFFLTEPRFTFHTYDTGYPLTCVIMLAASMLTGTLASKLKKEGRYVIISIEDNGAGIPDDMKENVFDTFFTCNNEIADNRRSLGLGLSLCKTIINAHGSELELRDNTPHGCIFEFKLQLSEVHLNE